MVFDIWTKCHGEKHITTFNEIGWRIVELQEKTSTRKLVDSIEEQKILDELIDECKPTFSSQIGFHPLLYTPFRSPPLKNGSRFGKKTEPSLWYGSLTTETTMAEKAYYQLAFMDASAGDFGTVVCFMTIFSVTLNVLRAIELNKPPFLQYKNQISSPIHYEVSQFLGQKMRENRINGFKFISARDTQGINVGIFKINSFATKKPDARSFQTWQCNTTKNAVEFIQVGSINNNSLTFPKEHFMLDGVFPFPAIT